MAAPHNCQSLPELKAALAAFDGCALKQTANNLVFGEGPLQAPICIVGEAPGAEEDKLGRPFMGRSGKLLEGVLQEVGLSRTTDVYITNAVNWRPPNNRPPTLQEINACRPFLHRHLELLKPAVLLLVGRTAAKAVLGNDAPMHDLRPQWLEFVTAGGQRIPARVTFHPAYILRNPAKRPDMLADLTVLKQWLQTHR